MQVQHLLIRVPPMQEWLDLGPLHASIADSLELLFDAALYQRYGSWGWGTATFEYDVVLPEGCKGMAKPLDGTPPI